MEKISRFFAFGCSYTNWPHPTWADFIGINFQEYYNYGKGGACNTYIANSFIEANDEYKFNNETDTIFIAMSGFGRFSYMANIEKNELDARIYAWETHGDTLFTNNEGHPEISKLIGNKIFNYSWAAYNSWISFITMKTILVEKKINHKIIMSINNKHYLTDFDLLDISDDMVKKIKYLYSKLDIDESIDEFLKANFPNHPGGIHPTKEIYYEYVLKYFPEYITEKSKSLLGVDIYDDETIGRLANRKHKCLTS
jgi:hypothetical protein